MEKDVSDNSNHKRAGVPMLTVNNTSTRCICPWKVNVIRLPHADMTEQ